MKPTRLELTGFRGIKDGLGRDSVEIIIPEAPLVSLAGPNGIGKSTVLDNLQPYRFMPSRAGEPSPRAFSFYDHIGPEAEKVLDWEHQGALYRTQFKLKQTAKTKKTEAVLLIKAGDDWAPAQRSGILSDGRSDTYDRLITEILGTPALYCATAFFAQNRKSLSSYKAGDVKLLLSELLQLSDYLEQSKQAKAVADALSVHLPSLRAHCLNREQYLADLEATTERAKTAHEQSKQGDIDIKRAREDVTLANKALAEAQAEAGNLIEINRRRDDLQSAIKATMLDRRRAADEADHQHQGIVGRVAKLEQTHASKQANLATDISGLQRTIQDRKRQIEAIERDAQTLEAERTQTRATITKLDGELEQHVVLDEQRHALAHQTTLQTQQLNEAQKEGRHLSLQTEQIKTRAALCDRVPCKGTDLQGRCELLKEAVDAKDTAGAYQDQLDAARQRYRNIHAALAQTQAQASALPPAQTSTLKQQLKDATEALAEIERKAAQREQLPALREHLASLEEQLSAKLAEQQQEQVQYDEGMALHRGDLAHIKTQAEQTLARFDQQIEQIKTELASLPADTQSARVEQATAQCAEAEARLTAVEAAKAEAQTTLANAQAERKRLETLLADMEGYASKIAMIENEIAHWGNLRRGLGRDGIVALCIDDAGPALAEIANDLLDTCFGGEYRIELTTQSVKCDGALKEDFDILVHGRDGMRPLRVMSGGQRVYLNEVLSTAIGLYEARHSRGRFHTRLADEVDGALDSARKLEFARLKRRALELAGFEREVFISHAPEIQDAADETIDLLALRV